MDVGHRKPSINGHIMEGGLLARIRSTEKGAPPPRPLAAALVHEENRKTLVKPIREDRRPPRTASGQGCVQSTGANSNSRRHSAFSLKIFLLLISSEPSFS